MSILTRKKKLLSQFPDFMKGSISLTSRSCGRASCKRCQRGEKHPMYLFGFRVKGKRKVLSVPPKLHKRVEKLIDNWKHHRDLAEELTDINVQLIKKGEFEE